jgi:predicted methyltransferase
MNKNLQSIYRQVAELTRLQEGSAGIEKIFLCVYQAGRISSHDLAEKTGLPIPVVAAIRREMEKIGFFERRQGIVLSEKGLKLATEQFGTATPLVKTEVLQGDTQPPLSQMTWLTDQYLELARNRPDPDRTLDQSHATLETVLKRVEYLMGHGLVQGKRVLFLGDDDLTSLALALVLKADGLLEATSKTSITVIDVDPRLVDFIESISHCRELGLDVIQGDLRFLFPSEFEGCSDFFFTDPPYTHAGIDLFLNRAVHALDPRGARRGCLAVPLSPPDLQEQTQKILLEHGFVINALYPGFNHYLGATMQGGISALYDLRLTHTGRCHNHTYNGPLYTAEFD